MYLGAGQPDNALKAFDEAARSAPRNLRAADNGNFDFMLAQGRSGAWQMLNNLERAVSFQQEAVQSMPDAPQPLRAL
jgi:hypothetical protein